MAVFVAVVMGVEMEGGLSLTGFLLSFETVDEYRDPWSRQTSYRKSRAILKRRVECRRTDSVQHIRRGMSELNQ